MKHTYSKTETKAKTEAGPCSCATHKQAETCCNLMCFERPNYFCGHLLTDRDLSKQQQYVIDKHKLYHRALHGQGIVCGLRLTCHHEADGHIMIDEGYAIDACGNDLVVCAPQVLPVIGLLREKKLIVEPFPTDPCGPEPEQPEYEETKCFYVTMCYTEEPADFTTPLAAGCRSEPGGCEPTRIREGVRFDVVDELPDEANGPAQMAGRLQGCSGLFVKGPFAQALQENGQLLKNLFGATGGGTPGGTNTYERYWNLFCQLRELFLRHLKKYPDNYNCSMESDLRYLPTLFPPQSETTGSVLEKIRDVFSRLLERANSYVVACIMGETIFPCPPVSEASCVVLGTVEVKNGRLFRVCNCPRSYVWSFANFWEVLQATVYGDLSCGENGGVDGEYRPRDTVNRSSEEYQFEYIETGSDRTDGKTGCCNEPDFDVIEFLNRVLTNRSRVYAGSLAIPTMATALRRSLGYYLNFSNPKTLSYSFLSKLSVEDFKQTAAKYNMSYNLEEQPAEARPRTPLEVIQSYMMTRGSQPLVAYRKDNEVIAVQPDLQQMTTMNPAIRSDIDSHIMQARDQAVAADIRAQRTQTELEKTREELTRKQDELASQSKEVIALKDALAAMQDKVKAVEKASSQIIVAVERVARVERDISDIRTRLPQPVIDQPAAEAEVVEAEAQNRPDVVAAAPLPVAAAKVTEAPATAKPKRTRKKPPQQ